MIVEVAADDPDDADDVETYDSTPDF